MMAAAAPAFQVSYNNTQIDIAASGNYLKQLNFLLEEKIHSVFHKNPLTANFKHMLK